MKQKTALAAVGAGNPELNRFKVATATNPPDDDGGHVPVVLLTEPEVAGHLRVSLACLRRWRLERRGPRFVKLGSLVRYPADELNKWIASLPTGGSAPGPLPPFRHTRGLANA